MGDFVLGLAKSVVEGALTKAQSAIEEEAKLRQSVQSDLVFITGEFQMMQSFLNATNEEHVRNNVVRTWVRQVRDLAYDVEDCIEFVVHLDKKPSWWFRVLPSCMAPALPLDEAVAEIKQLKARVEDVSRRNARYKLINDSGSKPATVGQQQPMATTDTTAFDTVQEARDTARKNRGFVDLTELIANMDDLGLQVISLWGTGGDLGTTSIIKKAYDNRDVRQAFQCRGWAKLTRPFNPHEFLRSLLTQFSASSALTSSGGAARAHGQKRTALLTSTEAAAQDEFIKDFAKQVEEKRYLVVLEDLSTVGEWKTIRMYLPNKKNGSRIVVSTQQLEIASLCTPQPCGLSELMQLSADHSVCVFYSKEGRPSVGGSTTNETILQDLRASRDFRALEEKRERNIMPDLKKNVTVEKMKLALDWNQIESSSLYREKESSSLYRLLLSSDRAIDVISVWGIAGVGKSTLVKDVYYRAVREPWFERCGWVDVSHSQPFDLREFCRSLLSDLYSESLEAKKNGRFGLLVSDLWFSGSRKALRKQKVASLEAGMLGFKDPIEECCKLLRQERCLVVIDGLRSTEEWDLIKAALVTPGAAKNGTRIMVIATEDSVATHCSMQDKGVFNVKGLGAAAALDLLRKEVRAAAALDLDLLQKEVRAAAALDLLKKEVFENTEIPYQTTDMELDTNIPDLTTDMEEQAKLLVDKCGGLPKVIAAIGGFLARRKTAVKWRELNDSFMHELETNPGFDSLRGLFTWMHSYFRTCPDYIKPCIFYLSIFPAGEYTSIRRRRLVRRWIAEGYPRDMDGHTAEEKGETFFSGLVGLSIIQQPPETATATYTHNKRMVSCQINGFFREYISSRPMEDNLVFALEGSCSVGATQCRPGRHLAIRRGWDRDPNVYGSIDFSRLRSLTVFGEWRPFFVSEGMRLLRVLDLEDSSGLKDDDLEKIGKLVPRLKFLSVRGCRGIHRLPDSLGGLTQLETLDARYTSVSVLPTAIVKLQKLQYLRAGAVPLDTAASPPPPSPEHPSSTTPSRRISRSHTLEPLDTAASPPPPCPEDPSSTTPSRRISRPHTLVPSLPKLRRHPQPGAAGPHVGVEVPRGGIVGKMTTLHTLGVVDVSVAAGQGEAVLKELKNLTQLRKLGVSGINPANSKELWSAISGHGHLESLSVRLEDDGGEESLPVRLEDDGGEESLPVRIEVDGGEESLPVWLEDDGSEESLPVRIEVDGGEVSLPVRLEDDGGEESLSARLEDAGGEQGLSGCPDDTVFSPPEKLQSLKLHGLVGKLPAWIKQLQNLNKLNLHMTILSEEDIYVLRDLPNLRILRLCLKRVQDDTLHFRRRPEDGHRQSSPKNFGCLGVLEIACNFWLEVIFGNGVMQNLELLKVRGCSGSSFGFSGLHKLSSIKRIFLKDYDEAVKRNLERQIGLLEYKPDLELE